MTLNLYFLRHGETVASKTDEFCGSSDVELTSEGIVMAKDFAVAYQSIPWKTIFCSPMRRTIATAKPLCDLLRMEMLLRRELKEIDFGEWEGKSQADVNRQFHDDYLRWQSEPGWNAPPGGERAVDIARRSSKVIEEIEQTYQSGNILIVSHKATIRIMLCSLLGIDVGHYRDRLDMPVAAISLVELTAHGPLLKKLCDRSHLN
ncbi:histidine phosphatase family protein [Pleurocapsa sp. FMAR1]|uniref:histidine phosphatase family protein n=1 Tax=Pleurocapsa sp. FMAR1 TaxID=3040204 RepID=UPI0029C791D5|nr:histidine phosphatase family protein [Pleurocapsa sp. FMAR1]